MTASFTASPCSARFGLLRRWVGPLSALAALFAFDAPLAAAPEPADILIVGGTVITMDAARRVIDDGAVAIVGDRIAAVGSTAELTARFRPRNMIDAHRKIVMPGLIDGHGHAGHELLKTLGADSDDWTKSRSACTRTDRRRNSGAPTRCSRGSSG